MCAFFRLSAIVLMTFHFLFKPESFICRMMRYIGICYVGIDCVYGYAMHTNTKKGGVNKNQTHTHAHTYRCVEMIKDIPDRCGFMNNIKTNNLICCCNANVVCKRNISTGRLYCVYTRHLNNLLYRLICIYLYYIYEYVQSNSIQSKPNHKKR